MTQSIFLIKLLLDEMYNRFTNKSIIHLSNLHYLNLHQTYKISGSLFIKHINEMNCLYFFTDLAY